MCQRRAVSGAVTLTSSGLCWMERGSETQEIASSPSPSPSPTLVFISLHVTSAGLEKHPSSSRSMKLDHRLLHTSLLIIQSFNFRRQVIMFFHFFLLSFDLFSHFSFSKQYSGSYTKFHDFWENNIEIRAVFNKLEQIWDIWFHLPGL